MRLAMWVFTVLGLMCSSAAISEFVRPRAMVSDHTPETVGEPGAPEKAARSV